MDSLNAAASKRRGENQDATAQQKLFCQTFRELCHCVFVFTLV